MWKKSNWIAYVVGFVAVALVCRSQDIQARPKYSTAFHEVYPDYKNTEGTKCNICHVGEKKTSFNAYGEAVGDALGAKNVKDDKAIEAALKKVEDKLPKKP